MTVDAPRYDLAWLAEAASTGALHTVRVSWSDRLGAWRGKRLPVDLFLESAERRVGFCDGMIVVDVNCDVHQETPFSNYETGYPDMYVAPDLRTLRPVGWADGEAFVLGALQSHGGQPLGVAPRNVLGSVLERLERRGIEVQARLTLSGRLMRAPGEPVALLPGGQGRDEPSPGVLRLAAEGLLASGVPVRSIDGDRDGAFRLALGATAAREAGDGAVLAKAALKEVALAHGLNAVFMTRLPDSREPSELRVELELRGAPGLDPDLYRAAVGAVRGLLQPSINAFKAGPARPPTVAGGSGGASLGGLRAASEADPLTVLAALAAAAGATLDGAVAPGDVPTPGDLNGAADLLAVTGWVADWLGSGLVDNAVPLLRCEAALFAQAVTDWETDRYWTQG